MSPLAITAIVYASGLATGLFYVGAKGIRILDDSADFEPGALVFIWPVAVAFFAVASPLLAGMAVRKYITRRRERIALAAQENQKWLESPLP